MTTTAALGTRIRARRRELHITQRELAATLDTTQTIISEWETGFRAVNDDELPDIAAALGVDVDELVAQPCDEMYTTGNERNPGAACHSTRVSTQGARTR